ncbi:MAG: PAS domain S-box protein [bacterium]|nr:PAS domain S-box protein [bacterium]
MKKIQNRMRPGLIMIVLGCTIVPVCIVSALFAWNFFTRQEHSAFFIISVITAVTGLAVISGIFLFKRALTGMGDDEQSRMKTYIDSIINSMPSVMISIDRKGRITRMNLEAEKVSGIDSLSAIGKPLLEIFPGYLTCMDQVNRSIAEKKPVRIEKFIFYEKDGIHYKDMVIYPLISRSEEGAALRIDDITEKVRIEEMMVRSEKMLTVGGLAAGMAHEINNPLSSIMQGAQNILMRISPNHPKNIEAAAGFDIDLDKVFLYLEDRGIIKFLNAIREAGKKASKIIEDILNFSRQGETNMVSTDPAVLLDKTIELAAHDYDLKKKFDFRNIEIARDIAGGIPPVPCTVSEIEQVLLNLLRNAAQAMMENEARGVKSRIVLRLRNEEDMIRIEVEDNGLGMDEETRKRIFEPFYTTREVGSGTGLGLSVAYFIVTNNHQGTMTVESEPGKGTRFLVRLPHERATDPA